MWNTSSISLQLQIVSKSDQVTVRSDRVQGYRKISAGGLDEGFCTSRSQYGNSTGEFETGRFLREFAD